MTTSKFEVVHKSAWSYCSREPAHNEPRLLLSPPVHEPPAANFQGLRHVRTQFSGVLNPFDRCPHYVLPFLTAKAHPNTLFSSVWSAASIFSPIWARCNNCICRILSVGHDLKTFVNRSSSGVNPSSLRSVEVDMRGASRLDSEAGGAGLERGAAAACDKNDPPGITATLGVTNAWPTEHMPLAHADNITDRAIIVMVGCWRRVR